MCVVDYLSILCELFSIMLVNLEKAVNLTDSILMKLNQSFW